MAAVSEESKTALLPAATVLGSSNAKLSIKIDIVNPIPAIIPTENNIFQLEFVGKSAKPILQAT